MSPKQRVARPVRTPRAACWWSGRHGARASAPSLLGVQPMPAGGSTNCTPTRCFRAACCTPPSRTPPRCSLRRVLLRPVGRRFALSHSALSHVRPVARYFRRVRHVGFRPVARSDAAHSALSLSGSLDSAALLRSDPSHSNLRASSDSLEYAPGAQRSKKLRRPDSNRPHSAPHSSVLTTAL